MNEAKSTTEYADVLIYNLVVYYTDEFGKRREKSKSTGLPIKGNKKKAEDMLKQFKEEFTEQLDKKAKSREPETRLWGSFQKNKVQFARIFLNDSPESVDTLRFVGDIPARIHSENTLFSRCFAVLVEN